MAKRRRDLSVRELVMLEAGYRCSVPTCRALTPLDVHHIDEHAKGGSDEASNLICLCCNCHNRYHREKIPSQQGMKVYKIRLQELSRAVDPDNIDLLLMLDDKLPTLAVSGDTVAKVAALLNTGYVQADYHSGQGQIVTNVGAHPAPHYRLKLTERGREFVADWKNGEQPRQ